MKTPNSMAWQLNLKIKLQPLKPDNLQVFKGKPYF